MRPDTGEKRLSAEQELSEKLGIPDLYLDGGTQLISHLSKFTPEKSPAHTLRAALLENVSPEAKNAATLQQRYLSLHGDFLEGHSVKIEEVTVADPTSATSISIIEITHFYPPRTQRHHGLFRRTVPGEQRSIAYQKVHTQKTWEPTTPGHRLSLQYAPGSTVSHAQTIVINPRSSSIPG